MSASEPIRNVRQAAQRDDLDHWLEDSRRCRDCGRRHESGGDALACDHRLGRHSTPAVWINSFGVMVGCPTCLGHAA